MGVRHLAAVGFLSLLKYNERICFTGCVYVEKQELIIHFHIGRVWVSISFLFPKSHLTAGSSLFTFAFAMEKHHRSPRHLLLTLRLLAATGGLASTISTAEAGTLTDNFGTTHDYTGGNVSGTIWSGMLNPGSATTANANSSNAGQLTLSSIANVGYDFAHNNAPFLYLNVTGDFDAKVQVVSATNTNFSVGSLMARMTPSLTGSNNKENFVSLNYNNNATTFDTGRNLVAGAETNDNFANDHYLELTRTGNAFTLLTSSDGTTYTQRDSFTRPDLAGQTAEVGLYYGTYTAATGTGQFDNFSISGINVPEPGSAAFLGFGLSVVASTIRRRRQ